MLKGRKRKLPEDALFTVFDYMKIDLEDIHILYEHSNWYINVYGYMACKDSWNAPTLYLARLIMNANVFGIYIDHINGDTLDNRKCNLRSISNGANIANRPVRSDSTNGYKGVQLLPYGRWRARGKNSKQIGIFDTPEEAMLAHKQYTEKLYGITLVNTGVNYA